MPCSSAALTTSSSRMLPPGWITARAPMPAITSRQSRNGKNASEAATDPLSERPAFFALMGVANLYVAFNYSTETWVNFKLFGFMGLMLVFVVLQGLMLGKYMVTDEDKEA